MQYTLGTAAKATGYTKPTIREAISEGRLSATKNEKGWYQIDPSELQRVYGKEMLEMEAKQKVSSETLQSLPPENDSAFQTALDALQQVIDEKDKTIARLEEDKETLSNDRENWRLEYQDAKQRLLTFEEKTVDVELPEEVEKEITPKKKRRWWQRKETAAA